jgi:hypothetical protein
VALPSIAGGPPAGEPSAAPYELDFATLRQVLPEAVDALVLDEEMLRLAPSLREAVLDAAIRQLTPGGRILAVALAPDGDHASADLPGDSEPLLDLATFLGHRELRALHFAGHEVGSRFGFEYVLEKPSSTWHPPWPAGIPFQHQVQLKRLWRWGRHLRWLWRRLLRAAGHTRPAEGLPPTPTDSAPAEQPRP